MSRIRTILGLATATLLLAAPLAGAHGGGHGGGGSGKDPFNTGDSPLDKVRYSTAHYFDLDEALEDGFGLLTDAEGIACIESDDPATTGTMGIHYVNGDRVADSKIQLRKPELLIYEPQSDGDMELIAVEYVVFRSAWRQEHPHGRPELFGRKFALVKAGNRYGIPAFFELHVWAWRHNETGTFHDYNPDVSCEYAHS